VYYPARTVGGSEWENEHTTTTSLSKLWK
jgi:hypothetical protein